MQKLKTNSIKNENIPNSHVSDMDEAILRWDKLMATIMITKSDQQSTIPEYTDDASIFLESAQRLRKAIEDEKQSKTLSIKNKQSSKMKVDNLKIGKIKPTNKTNSHNNVSKSEVGNIHLSNTNKFEPLKHEMEKMNITIEQLNNTLQTVTAEMSNKKSIVSMTSSTAVLDRYNLELGQKTQDEISYKEKLDTKTKELQNVHVEISELLKRLEESEVALANTNEKIRVLSIKSDNEYDEKLKEIEEERFEWNSYQLQLENLISEGYKALNRKEEYIKHHDFTIDNLRQEKIELETQLLNRPVLKLPSDRSEEIENYQTQNRKLSAIIKDINIKLASTIESHNTDMLEKRERLKGLKILIATKNDVINRQNMTLDSMRDINKCTQHT